MRRGSMVAMIVGGAFLVAYLPGLVRREPAPAAPVASAAPVAAPAGPTAAPASGGDLKAMLEIGRKARLERPRVTRGQQRQALAAAIARGPADTRSQALRSLALDDRAAADAIARRSLGDHVLFAGAARLLLVRPDGRPDAADIAQVRSALRTGQHDDASRATVATLLLDALVKAGSPAVATFVVTLQEDPSTRVQAVAARYVGAAARSAKPPRRAAPG